MVLGRCVFAGVVKSYKVNELEGKTVLEVKEKLSSFVKQAASIIGLSLHDGIVLEDQQQFLSVHMDRPVFVMLPLTVKLFIPGTKFAMVVVVVDLIG